MSQAQAAPQFALSHEPSPAQSTSQRPVPHVTVLHVALSLQFTSQRPAPQVTLLQVASLMQLTSAAPLPPMNVVQARAPLQLIVEVLAEPPRTLRQESLPMQSRVQVPLLHATLEQLLRPVHSTLQSRSEQVMPERQEPLVLHSISQFQPPGQTTGNLQPLLWAQSILHILLSGSQEVQIEGQAALLPPPSLGSLPPSIGVLETQRPSTQTRPSAQSAVPWHEKSPLRWLTEQLAAVRAARVKVASQSATSFTAALPS